MIANVDITPDYAFYTESYHGKMRQGDFDAALPDAIAEVENRIWFAADVEPHIERCKLAVCAICEAVGNLDRRMRSYSSGKTSQTFSAPPFSLSAEAAVKRYLGPTGILKRGQWL